MRQRMIPEPSNGQSGLSGVVLIVFIHFNADSDLIAEC